MERFLKFDEKGNVSSKVSVTVTKVENLFSKAIWDNQQFSWVSDEKGPSPLAYFVSSLAMCQMIHHAEHPGSKELRIDDLTIKVKGKFKISRSRSFLEITIMWTSGRQRMLRISENLLPLQLLTVTLPIHCPKPVMCLAC